MPINYKINNLLSAVMPGVECRTKKLALESILWVIMIRGEKAKSKLRHGVISLRR
jgi:hypothetical protein